MNFYIAIFAIFAIIGFSTAEIVHFTNCTYPDPNTPINCTIHEVRVEPCKEAAENKPCRAKRGTNSSISFDYTTNFAGDTLESRAYWANQVIDLPFLGMPTDACVGTPCPAKPGQKQTYTMIIPISKKYPARSYDLKWRLWNAQEQECCFMFQIKIHK